jgi:phospholipid/cholesterol/gamma-HCH transport system substrate-binding protein
MEKSVTRNLRLGLIVSAGTLFLITMLYMIGTKRNMFSDSFRLAAEFHNVNGLMEGNNVRFSGINVGIVESVDLFTDSSVKVNMLIDKKARRFIKKNAVAAVGTDGLMGNKLVNINSMIGMSPQADDGDQLNTLRPIETDEMLRTLNTTNENLKWITGDLRDISGKLSRSNSLWSLLQDTVIPEDLKLATGGIRLTAERAAQTADNLNRMSSALRTNNGVLNTLFYDTLLSYKVKRTVGRIDSAGATFDKLGKKLNELSSQVNMREGALGLMVSDTVFAGNLKSTVKNFNNGAKGFDENMEALKHSLFLRKYYKRKSLQKAK